MICLCLNRYISGFFYSLVSCIVRGKPIKLTPEEAVRQLYLLVLRDDMGYPVSRMELEYEVTFGREKKRADICIFDKDKTTTPYILVELKKPKLKDGKEQLKSYCNATGAPMGVWTNGSIVQDRLFESDFDRFLKQIESGNTLDGDKE